MKHPYAEKGRKSLKAATATSGCLRERPAKPEEGGNEKPPSEARRGIKSEMRRTEDSEKRGWRGRARAGARRGVKAGSGRNEAGKRGGGGSEQM